MFYGDQMREVYTKYRNGASMVAFAGILQAQGRGTLQPTELMELTEKVFGKDKQPFTVVMRRGDKVTIKLLDGTEKEYTL